MNRYDLIVIGAGAGGLGAARAARKAGRRVALIDSEPPGGECTHYGCVPSKTLLEATRRIAAAAATRDQRIPVGARDHRVEGGVDFVAVMSQVARVVEQISGDESPAVLAGEGIDLITGRARMLAADTIEVDGRHLKAARVVLATGSSARIPPIPGLGETPHLDNQSVFALRQLPRHLVVLGGGAIGCELAQAFRRLGSSVTIIEAGPALLSHEEPEASDVLRRVLQRGGVTVHTGASVTRITTTPGGEPIVDLEGATVAGSHLLVAVGRAPVTDGLGLDAAGVALDQRGQIVTDAYLRTTAPGVYAVGDCAARLKLTHVADEQGRLAVGNAFAGRLLGRLLPAVAGGRGAWSDTAIPWVTFTDPEIARVGMSEAQAYAAYGSRARVSVVPMAAMDRARCAGEPDGFVKLVAVPGRLLRGRVFLKLVGMTAVAAPAGEMIAEAALAIRAGILLARMAQTVHAYPTWSIATRLAAASFFGEQHGITARPARPAPDTTGTGPTRDRAHDPAARAHRS
ncbi:MAG: dihydrolipoyl dehydrogenase family protein [Pseudonocardiaceae bacterium]